MLVALGNAKISAHDRETTYSAVNALQKSNNVDV